jgi:hypothetical protein
VLISLRLGRLATDISERFNISEGTLLKYFSTWIFLLQKELKFFTPFTARDVIGRIMPSAFKMK